MAFALTAAIKDLRRRLTDPTSLVMWLGLPIVIGTLMSLLNSGGGPAIKAHVLVVDEDETFLSRIVTSAGNQREAADVLQMETVGAAEGRRRIDAGDASALLTIPHGFQDAVLRDDRQVTLTLVKNPAQRILPDIVEEAARMLVEAAFYVQHLFGAVLRRAADTATGAGTPSDDVVATISRLFNQRLRGLEKTLVPPVLSLQTTAPPSTGPAVDFWSLFLPGLVFMSIMFAAQGMSIDIWTEKHAGTIRRALMTPRPAGAFLGGKLLAGMAIMATAVGAALVLGVTLFHVPIARAPLAFVWATFAGGAIFCFLVLVQLHASSMRGGQFLSSTIVFPLIMLGGSFFPLEVMPAWMSAIGRWTPNGLGVATLKQILFGRVDPGVLALAVAGLAVPAALAFWLGVRRMRVWVQA